jgi:hypothetical protein
MATLFDMDLRASRRDRAARIGPELFLLDRAFEDCLERLSLVQRRFESALLIGCPNAAWRDTLSSLVSTVDVRDPGDMFARMAGGETLVEDSWEPEQSRFDLVVAIGTLDTVNDLPRALLTIRWGMKPDGLLLGALSGGNTVPRLRSAMRAADMLSGVAHPHIHPRVEPSALAPLLAQAGFANPVVDVDRASVSYRSFGRLLSDLRAMAATNILTERSRQPLSRAAYAAAAAEFASGAQGGQTVEIFEILHFACWSAAEEGG